MGGSRNLEGALYLTGSDPQILTRPSILVQQQKTKTRVIRVIRAKKKAMNIKS